MTPLRLGQWLRREGFGASFIADPAEDLVAVLLTQRLMRSADDTAISQDFLTLTYQAIDD